MWTPPTMVGKHCHIDAERCQRLPAAGQVVLLTDVTRLPRRSAAMTRAAAFCQLCSERCGTSVTNHCHACLATGSRPAAVAFCAYARTPTTYGKYRQLSW